MTMHTPPENELALVSYPRRSPGVGVASRSPGFSSSILSDHFTQFFALAVELKAMTSSTAWESNKEVIYQEKLGPVSPDRFVQDELLDLLTRQERTICQQYGMVANVLYKEAQYLMVALADEIFLNADWPGALAWRSSLLEENLFQSHVAGDQVFERIEQILRSRDPAHYELASLYLRLLGCGFEGKYRGHDALRTLVEFRHRLYILVCGSPPNIHDKHWSLVPSAYSNVYEGKQVQFLKRRFIWPLIPLAILLAGLIASTILWFQIKGPLQRSARQVLTELPEKH